MTRHNDISEALALLAAELLQIAKSAWAGYDATGRCRPAGCPAAALPSVR